MKMKSLVLLSGLAALVFAGGAWAQAKTTTASAEADAAKAHADHAKAEADKA